MLLLQVLILSAISLHAKNKVYTLTSPDNTTRLKVEVGSQITWSLIQDGTVLITPSPVSLSLEGGSAVGINEKVKSDRITAIDTEFEAINYRKKVVENRCQQLDLQFRSGFGIQFRLYNDAAAYHFTAGVEDELVILGEEANFNFPADHMAYVPYLWDYRGGEIYNASFESMYTREHVSEFATDSLAFLPLMVDAGQGRKLVIMEADLESYPGMFLQLNETGRGYEGTFAPYPLEYKIGGYNELNLIPTKRAPYIAKTDGGRTFPWRIVAFSREDKELLNNDIVQKLASPPRMEDVSWIEPGQVAWDWWDDYSITGVDFEAGINTETFKYYADFAAANGAKYIVVDWGWNFDNDLTRPIPEMDIPEIVDYAAAKGVGVILWASWRKVVEQGEEVFPKYAAMGVKGWKIDFIDRDDQVAVQSTYDIAELAAKYKMLVDYHGVFKPTGLQRTWPNVLGYEGVYGMETVKWAKSDAPRYVVTLPFIRNMAGPMDYTSGAMINATEADFVARNSSPMSLGTRCHQVAQFVVFEVPIQMLSDAPSRYMLEQECTDFITAIPTVFDETVPLAGKVGEYVAVARRKGDTWYIGALTNWDERELELNLSFLGESKVTAVVMEDGVNANHTATDYKLSKMQLDPTRKLKIRLAQGGGWAARIQVAD